MKQLIYLVAALTFTACSVEKQEPIDRYKLVTRNNPSVTAVDSLASLQRGTGGHDQLAAGRRGRFPPLPSYL